MAVPPAGPEVLSHVPREERLHFAVALLLETQSFPLRGVDLECRLQRLLAVNGSTRLAQELCMESTHYGVTLGHLDSSKLQLLLDEASDYAAAFWQRFCQRMRDAQYPGIPELASAFKRQARESGISHNLHLVDLRSTGKGDVVGALWAKTLKSLGMPQEELLQRLQMVAGQVHLRPSMGLHWALPLSAALLRLSGLPEAALGELRHQILSRHHSMSHVFDTRLNLAASMTNKAAMAKLLFEDFRSNFHQIMSDVDDDEEYERRLAALFAACDAHQDGAVDQEELQQALSVCAPPAGLSRLRTLAILQYGGWKAAWQSVGVTPEDLITVARFVALAANLDISYEDAWAIFSTLSPTGEAISYHQLVQHGGDFTLHEFALRAWLACEVGGKMEDVAKRLQSPMLDGDLNLQTFRQVCGVNANPGDSLGLDSSLGPSLGLTKGGLATKPRIPQLKCQPPLTEGEVEAAYGAFKAKYFSVTLGAIRSELTSNTAFSEVLALDRISASIGETMICRYRVPRELQSQLREHSFIALVPSNMYWTSGGGGSWMLGRQTVTEMTGPKFSLNRSGEGVVRLQVWPGVSQLDLGAADLRIFSSPDAMAIGKQVGGSARFQLRPPAPGRVMTESASLTPTSISLLWEAPHAPMTSRGEREQHFRYVVRGKPMGLEIEQDTDSQERQMVWSHLKKKRMKFLTHEVNGLLPGVRYKFQVHAITDGPARRRSLDERTPSASPVATPRDGGAASWAVASFGAVAPGATAPGLESLASPGVEVTMPQRPAPPQPSHAVLVDRGLGGSFTLRWAPHDGAKEDVKALDYEVFWTVPGEEAEADTAQLHADQEDQSCFGQRSAVWRYPLPVFLRKTAEGTVEGLLHPPEADGVADGKAVRFCVRAVDPITGSTSMMGDLGPPIQLPSAAEVILRNVDAVNQIGEGAVRAGGFKRFLEDAEDAGLIGGEGTEVDLRKQLYEKVESAGGLESMLEALADLQMKNFKEACEVVRSIQESTELTAEETPSWQHVVKLVAGAGGAKKFTRSFTTVELAEVLGNTQQLAALGIFEGKSEDHTLRDALLTNDEHMPQFFSKIQEELGGLTLDERQVADLSSALGIMARRSKGNWTELVDLIAGEGGPTPVQPLVKYSEGHVQELHSAMQLSSLDVEGLISFLKTAGEAEFIGQSADAKVREDFLTKLSAAGGASVLYSSLQGMDLKALRPAIMVARAANLHRESCLQVTAGSISRADAWHKLVEIIESKWGGPQAFLAASGELYESHRAIATERREESAFDGLVEQTGGRMAVTELLNLTASAGGVQHVLKALGPVQLSQVCNFLESLRRGGGRFQDLEKLSAMLGEAGGLTRLVKRIEAKVQDTSKLAEIIEGGATFERHGFLDLPDKEREKVPEVLAKVLAETTLTRFLKVFDAVRLSSLLELVPLLVSAGALRSKGQAQSEDEVAAAGKSILGWLSRAGGSFLVCSPVYQCEARMFLKFMEQANNMGLSQLRPASLSKVGAFLTELSRQCGSLEDFVAMIGETDLVQLVSTLNSWRFVPLQNSGSESLEDATESAPGSVEKVKAGEPFEPAMGPATGPATPEEAQEVQDALEALRLVAHKSGIEGIQRLVQVSQKVECLERLEKGLELLESARLIRPWQSKGEIPDHWQLVAEFEPWNHLVSLVNSFGGPERFNQRVEAVNLQHFDECVEFLDAAGLTSASMKVDDGFSESMKAWTEVIRILVSSGGPALFLESLQGIVVDDFLKVVSLLRQAGLARRLEDEDVFPEMTKRLSFTYGYGESAGRIRNEMLLDFVQRVIQAGGFHAFWHALKGVDLMKLKGDLHCLVVIRQKLQELIAEDWWLAVHDAEGLEELLHSHLAERKRRADDLTLRQRERLVNRFKEIGGVEAFLDGFNNINLAQMLAQHKALHTARIKEVAVIEALAKIGQLVKNKVEHLNGLEAVAATLVRWGDRHYRGEEPVRLWKAMHQQVTWLLLAIEENGALLKATVNHSNHPGKEPELTPARLAQFLQALRPVGGVPGFLSAFRGLDFSTAAQQARILHDACVRSPETTKRLAYLYRLLRNSSTQLRGLEHFLRNFAAPVLAEAATQGSTAQDRLQVAERWQRLTAYLGQAAGKTPAGDEKYENSPRTASGADQVLEVLLLGLRLTEASGLKASKQDWDQLCHEIKCEPGLPGVLARLRGSKTSVRHGAQRRSAPASMATNSTAPLSSSVGALLVRNFLPPCMEEGSDGYAAADAFASEPERRAPPRPSDVAPRRRPESAARARSSSVPEVLRTSPVPGWSPAESS